MILVIFPPSRRKGLCSQLHVLHIGILPGGLTHPPKMLEALFHPLSNSTLYAR